VPLNLEVTLHNPYAQPILVNGVIGIAQSGIGLTTGPIKWWEGQRIEAGATVVLQATYTPLVEGHFPFRFRFAYSWSQATTAGPQDGCGFDPACNWSAFLGLNTNSAPASTDNDTLRAALGVQRKKVKVRDWGAPTTPPSDTDPAKKDINQQINDSSR